MPQNEVLVFEGAVSIFVPELQGVAGEAQPHQAHGSLSRPCPEDEHDHCLGVSAALITRSLGDTAMDDMLWFGGHWWWFPDAWIGADSEFEWTNDRVYLLEPDGSAVVGILFVGEASPD